MDEEIGLPSGTAELVKGSASLSPLELAKGFLSLIGVETNHSLMERAVARDYEEWLFETLMGLKAGSKKADDERHIFGARLDGNEARQAKLDWIIDEFQKRLGDAEARIGDLMALFEAGYEVWKLNMQPVKRQYLSLLLKKAFDPATYKEGKILEFIAALRQINVRQVQLLQDVCDGGGVTPNRSSVTQRALDLDQLSDLRLLFKTSQGYAITEFGADFARHLKGD